MEKVCSKCKISKNIEDFCIDKRNENLGRSFGKAYRCKKCQNENKSIPSEETKRKRYEYNKRVRIENPEMSNKWHRKYYKEKSIEIKIIGRARANAKKI